MIVENHPKRLSVAGFFCRLLHIIVKRREDGQLDLGLRAGRRCLIMRHPMRFSGHVIGLLKEYMHDLVEQARQETAAHAMFGFSSAAYQPDQAISDLLAILDDRIESEGVQVGLPDNFLHAMWTICNQAREFIREDVWLQQNVGPAASKSLTRERTYRALLAYIEREQSSESGG